MSDPKTPKKQDYSALINSVENILVRLTQSLKNETDALMTRKHEAAAVFQAEKSRLMEDYRALYTNLSAEVFESMDEEGRAHIKQMTVDFQDALQKNMTAVRAAHYSVTRLIDRILDVARKNATQDAHAYNAQGALVGAYGPQQSMSTRLPTRLNTEL